MSFTWLITGGFAKGYRTQILGLTAALSAIGMWAVGDLGLYRSDHQGTDHLRRPRPCRARRQG